MLPCSFDLHFTPSKGEGEEYVLASSLKIGSMRLSGKISRVKY